jgi:hypothetical protein
MDFARAGDPFEAVHVGRQVHLHIAHARRARDLFVFKHDRMVLGRTIGEIVRARHEAQYRLQRVHLDLQAGEHAQDYAQVAAKDKLNELQLRVRQLLDQVDQITKEQNYQRVGFAYGPIFMKQMFA